MTRPTAIKAVTLLGAVALGVLTAREPATALIAVLVAVALVVGVERPFAVGLLLLAWGAVRFTVLDAVGGFSWLVNYGEIAIAGYVVLLAVLSGSRGHWLLRSRPAAALASLFVVAAALSWVLNRGTPLELLAGLRGHLLVPIVAVATALLSQGERDRRLALGVAVGLSLLQLPVAVYQFVAAGDVARGPDIVVGTLGPGGANVLGLWMLAAMTAAGIEYVRTRKTWLLIAIAAWAWPFVASSSRLGLLLAIPAVLVVVTSSAPRNPFSLVPRRTIVLIVGVALVTGLVGVYYQYRASTAERDFSVSEFLRSQAVYRETGVSRLGYVVYGWEFMKARSAFVPLGTGPASAASGAAQNLGTAGYWEFWYGLQLFGRSGSATPASPGVVPLPTQFPATLVEYGPIGVALFLAFYVVIGLKILMHARAVRSPGADWRVFALWLTLATVGTLYANSWEGFSIIALAFWWWPLMLSDASATEVIS